MNVALSTLKWLAWPFYSRAQTSPPASPGISTSAARHTRSPAQQRASSSSSSSSADQPQRPDYMGVLVRYATNYSIGLVNATLRDASSLVRVWVRAGPEERRVSLSIATLRARATSSARAHAGLADLLPRDTSAVFLEYAIREGSGATTTYKICCSAAHFAENGGRLLTMPYELNASPDLVSSSDSSTAGPQMLPLDQTLSSCVVVFPGTSAARPADRPPHAIDITRALAEYAGVNSDFHGQAFDVLYCLHDALDGAGAESGPDGSWSWQRVAASAIRGAGEPVFRFTNSLGRRREVSASRLSEITPFSFERLFPAQTPGSPASPLARRSPQEELLASFLVGTDLAQPILLLPQPTVPDAASGPPTPAVAPSSEPPQQQQQQP